jgi:tape measure domain-containing protein
MADDKEFLIRVRADVRRALDQMQDLTGKLEQTAKSGRNAARGTDQTSLSLRELYRQAVAAAAALGAIQAGRGIVQASLDAERMERALKLVTGSSEGAAREMDFVRAVSDQLGLNLRTVAQDYAALAAASRGTSLQGAETREIFVAVAEASTALGLSADQTSGALTAIQQIISKGTVSAEELRGQLGERLFGAFQTAARSMGITTQELGKFLEAGALASDEFLPRFARQLRTEFGGAAEEGARSAQAAFNRFQTEIFDLQVALGRSGFLATVVTVTDELGNMADAFVATGLKAEDGEESFSLLRKTLRIIAFVALKLKNEFVDLGDVLNGLNTLAAAAGDFGPGYFTRFNAALEKVSAERKAKREKLLQEETAFVAKLEGIGESKPEIKTGAEGKPPSTGGSGQGDADAAAREKARQAIDAHVQALQLEAATYGLTRTQAELYRLTLAEGIEPEQLAAAEAALKSIDAMEQQSAWQQQLIDELEALKASEREHKESLEDQADAIRDSVDPTRALNREFEELNKLQAELQAAGLEPLSEEQLEARREQIRQQIQDVKNGSDQMSEFSIQAARNMQSAFAEFLYDPFEEGLEGMVRGFADAMRRLAAEALAAAALQALFKSAASSGNPYMAAFGAAFSSAHQGGIAGATGQTRTVSPLVFAGVPRMHSGGFAGLRANEVPTILERGEEVLTRDDPRHAANGGGQGQGVRIVNVLDPKLAGDYLSSSEGERVILNVLQKNPDAVRRVMR